MGTGAEVFAPRQTFKRLWVTLKVPGNTMMVINASYKGANSGTVPKAYVPRHLIHPHHHPKSKSDFCITNGTEAQRSYIIHPKSHSKEGITTELEPRQSDP